MSPVQSTDLLLINRAGVDYQAPLSQVKDGVLGGHVIQSPTPPTLVTHPGIVNGTIWVDISQVPPVMNVWDSTANGGAGGFEEVSGSTTPRPINPAPGDWTPTPAFLSGTGTQADPFVITPSTVATAGGTVQAAQTLALTRQKVGNLVEVTDLSAGASNRFQQTGSVVPASGAVSLRFQYADTPASTVETTYTGSLKVGTTYFRWVVTQQVVVVRVPNVASVTLADVAGGDRFTSVAFPVSATMGDDGLPVSTKKIKAYVEGQLKSAAQSSAITNVALGPLSNAFATTLYTGNGTAQTITNGIDLAGAGGLVWIKSRNSALNNLLVDTARGVSSELRSNTSDAAVTPAFTGISSFTPTGFSLGEATDYNGGTGTYVSWTFRKAAKFFDVVTYTGTGSAQAISHALGSVPGFIVAKRTDNTSDWIVYHRSRGATKVLTLNSTGAEFTAGHWDNTTPTSTQFYVGGGGVSNNISGSTYVAYLFAHDTDPGGLIQCGDFTDIGFVGLGWEPQFLLFKRTDSTSNWFMLDSMRGFSQTKGIALYSNLTDAEADALGAAFPPSATGFTNNAYMGSWIYIAIRGSAQVQSTVLTLTDNSQLAGFAAGDSVTETTAADTAGDAKGGVSAVDSTANTITLGSSSGTWDVGSKVKGPLKASGPNAKLFCKLDAAGAVSDLQGTDPGFTAWTPTGAGPYTGSVTFPATLPTGAAPDADMPAGTSITVEVEASNASGSDSAKSNTVTPA